VCKAILVEPVKLLGVGITAQVHLNRSESERCRASGLPGGIVDRADEDVPP